MRELNFLLLKKVRESYCVTKNYIKWGIPQCLIYCWTEIILTFSSVVSTNCCMKFGMLQGQLLPLCSNILRGHMFTLRDVICSLLKFKTVSPFLR